MTLFDVFLYLTSAKRLMWDLLTSHFKPNGPKSAILTTHSMEEVEALSTKMAIMRKGVVQCLGTVWIDMGFFILFTVFSSPAHL